MLKNIIAGYLVLLHLFVVLILVKTDFIERVGYKFDIIEKKIPEITQHYKQTVKFLERIDANTPDGAVIFIGDSGIQGLCVSAIANPSVNFGIGTDTTVGVLQRLPMYQSLQKASACVLSIGGNDIRRRDNKEILKNYSLILQTVPSQIPVIINAVLPVDESAREDLPGRNRRSRELNNSLEILCTSKRSNCTFVDIYRKFTDSSGNLKKEYHIGDGVHLNSAGNALWIRELKTLLNH